MTEKQQNERERIAQDWVNRRRIIDKHGYSLFIDRFAIDIRLEKGGELIGYFDAAKEAICHAEHLLKLESEMPNQSGRYILNSDGYKKEVEAVFDDAGNLTSLVDDEGNSWLDWAKNRGVLDPDRENYYLESV